MANESNGWSRVEAPNEKEGELLPDEHDEFETWTKQELDSARLDNELKQARIADVKSDRDLRETYAQKIIQFMRIYASCVLIVLLLSGFEVSWYVFKLPDPVLAILVGSTAVAVVGLVGFIARGLFRTPPSLPE